MSQREDLLAGAKKCLGDKGYSRTTARDIAAASGAHLASIGYHFGSKDNLMNTAVIEASSEWGDLFEAGVREAGGRTPRERVHDLLEFLFRTMPDQRPVLVAGTQALAQVPFDADVREKMTAAHEQARVSMAALILGVPEEDVDSDTATGLGAVTYALVVGFVMQGIVAPDSLPSPAQAAAAITALAEPAASEGSAAG